MVGIKLKKPTVLIKTKALNLTKRQAKTPFKKRFSVFSPR